MQQKSDRNYWPHAIVISILLIACACAMTVYIALRDAPVELDTFYFDSYNNIDKNINEIREKQKIFDEKYEILFKDLNNLSIKKENKIALQILNKNSDAGVSDASIKMLLTRPETNRFNINATSAFKDGEYLFLPIDIVEKGRWLIQVKIEIDDDVGFFTQEVYVAN